VNFDSYRIRIRSFTLSSTNSHGSWPASAMSIEHLDALIQKYIVVNLICSKSTFKAHTPSLRQVVNSRYPGNFYVPLITELDIAKSPIDTALIVFLSFRIRLQHIFATNQGSIVIANSLL